MKHIAIKGLAIGFTTLLAGCGWSDRGGLEHSFVDAGAAEALERAWSAPQGLSTLPPGHPPIKPGTLALPPGHPPIPEGLSCPGGGAARERAGQRHGADRHETISI